MDAWPCMHGGWACWPATGPSRAAQGRRTTETRRPPGGARRRGRTGVDDDGGAAELDVAEHGRDVIDVVDRKVEDEQRNRSIYIGRDPLVPTQLTSQD